MNEQDRKDLGVLEGRLKGIDNKLDQLNKHLIGNGQKGLLERQTRVEEHLDVATENLKDFSDLCHTIGGKVTEAEKHIADKTVHTAKGLLLNMGVISIFLLSVLALIAIVPPEITIWEIVKSWMRF